MIDTNKKRPSTTYFPQPGYHPAAKPQAKEPAESYMPPCKPDANEQNPNGQDTVELNTANVNNDIEQNTGEQNNIEQNNSEQNNDEQSIGEPNTVNENKKPEENRVITKIANILSGLFSPLFVPTYGYAIVMWVTPLSVIPERTRFLSTMIILFITAMLPVSVLLFMVRHGKISDYAVSNKDERTVPLIVTMICYAATAFYLRYMPAWVPGFFIGACIAAFLTLLINTRWKISAHAIAMGGLCATLAYIGINGLSNLLIIPWITNAIIISGAVCSARLYLHRHTPGQVYAGWSMGFVVTYLAMQFL